MKSTHKVVEVSRPRSLSSQVSFRMHHLEEGTFIETHSHAAWQFAYARNGIMHVNAEGVTHVLPPQYGMWIPGNTLHSVQVIEQVDLESLYISELPALDARLGCRVVMVTDLVREFIHYACTRIGSGVDTSAATAMKVQVLLDLVAELPEAPLHLPMPSDLKMAEVCAAIQDSPDQSHAIGHWARALNTTPPTFSRRFQHETGMTFQAWKQRLRLLKSLTLLKDGSSVSRVALDLGYSSSSAYIYAFRRLFGCSPMQFSQGKRDGVSVTVPTAGAD